MTRIVEALVRFRTWVVNTVFVALVTPDVILVLLGFDWGLIIPQQYMPFVTLAVALLNVWMRPRPAVLPTDPEVDLRRTRMRRTR